MKQSLPAMISCITPVAPCAGAWIETITSSSSSSAHDVAPCAGAWIETIYLILICVVKIGRPLRGGVD